MGKREFPITRTSPGGQDASCTVPGVRVIKVAKRKGKKNRGVEGKKGQPQC